MLQFNLKIDDQPSQEYELKETFFRQLERYLKGMSSLNFHLFQHITFSSQNNFSILITFYLSLGKRCLEMQG